MAALLACLYTARRGRHNLGRAVLLVGIIFLGMGGISRPLHAEGGLIFQMTLYQTPPLVAAGDLVKYRFTFSCSSLQTGCGAVTITDALPATLEYVGAVMPNSLRVTQQNGVVTLSRDNMLDGDSGEAIIVTRVKPGLPSNTVIENRATATITIGVNDQPTTYPAGPVTVTTTQVTPAWHVEKQRSSPPEGSPVTLDTDVTYRVRICADRLSANQNLVNAQLVDTFPANAQIVSYQQGRPGEVTIVGNQVTWNLGALFLSDLYPPDSDPTKAACVNRRLVLRYPASHFNMGDIVTNVVEGADNGGVGPLGSAQVTHGFAAPTPQATLNKSATADQAAPGSPVTWLLEVGATQSTLPLDNLVLTDPLVLTETIAISSGAWLPASIKAEIAYSTNQGTAWQVLGVVNGNANRAWAAPAQFPTRLTHVRWSFFDDSSGTRVNRVPSGFTMKKDAAITQRISAGTALSKVRNCAGVTYSGGATPQECHTVQIMPPAPVISVEKSVVSDANVHPNEAIRFRLRFRPDPTSLQPLINPSLSDLLPAELTFDRWESVQVPAGAPGPNLEVIDNYHGSGRQMVRFSWQATPPANSRQLNGAPGIGNPYTVPVSPAPGWIEIEFSALVNAAVAPGNYTNKVLLTEESPVKRCSQGSSTTTDAEDWDDDGDTTETACPSSASWTAMTAVLMASEKWVRGYPGLSNVDDPASLPQVAATACPDDGAGYTRYPCVARTIAGGDFEYRLRLTNIGNVGINHYVLYDVLPAVGDTGVSELLATQPRQSYWRPFLLGPVIAEDAFTAGVGAVIEYSVAANACRPEMSNKATDADWQVACVNDWTHTPADYSKVQAIRISVPFTRTPFLPGQQLLFHFAMRAPADAPTVQAAWNSLAHRSNNAESGERLLTSEPRKVGIIIPERFDLALQKTLAAGQPSVISPGQPVTFTMTVINQGVLTATNLQIVDYLPPAFSVSAQDHNGWSSNGVTATVALPGFLAPGASRAINLILTADAQAAGVYTNTAEICTASNVSGDLFDVDSIPDCVNQEHPIKDNEIGENGRFYRDQDEDDHDIATITVAATPRVALGNLVFADLNNNGRFEAEEGETGIDGVRVTLHQGNNAVNSTAPFSSTITAGGGFYLFDQLAAGHYVVCVAADNFLPQGPLYTFISSTGVGAGDTIDDDGDENGIDPSQPGQQAICSGEIDLEVGRAPQGETGAGQYTGSLNDANVNLTVDFGYYQPVAIGDRVWVDHNGNGLQDAEEEGVAGVTVHLLQAAAAPGLTTTTDATGYYRFPDLPPGAYAVRFDLSSLPEGMIVTTPDAGGGQQDAIDSDAAFTTGETPYTPFLPGGSQDLTLDMGIVLPMSLGNRVWRDTGAGSNKNNGELDPDESGLAHVIVTLRDPNRQPIWAANGQPISTTTDTNGYYLFDSIPPGVYIICVDEQNFRRAAPLEQWFSSTPSERDTTINSDNNDNGLDNDDPSTEGICSARVILEPEHAPTDETDLGNAGHGSASDANSNLTIDFGFFEVTPTVEVEQDEPAAPVTIYLPLVNQ